MPADTKSRNTRSSIAASGKPGDAPHAGAIAQLVAIGTAITARAGQTIALSPAGTPTHYLCRSGLLSVALERPEARPCPLLIVYAGEILATFAPPLRRELTLTAALPSQLIRIPSGVMAGLACRDEGVARYLAEISAAQLGRQMLHSLALCSLGARERVASFLIELALRLAPPHQGLAGGERKEDVRAFEMPLSRSMMAEHLSLNADTLSRILSALKADGVLVAPSRHRAIIRKWAELCRMSPIAGTLIALHEAGAHA